MARETHVRGIYLIVGPTDIFIECGVIIAACAGVAACTGVAACAGIDLWSLLLTTCH